jgi:hypothetical protein
MVEGHLISARLIISVNLNPAIVIKIEESLKFVLKIKLKGIFEIFEQVILV